MAISEDVSNEEVDAPPMEDLLEPANLTLPSNPPEVELIISLSSLIDVFTLETLKIIG
jgi:hypothetical protein